MNIQCDLCVEQYGASEKTDQLWIKTINGHDYLVCALHKGEFQNANRREDDSKTIDAVL